MLERDEAEQDEKGDVWADTASVTEIADNVPSEFMMEHRGDGRDDASYREGAYTMGITAHAILEALRTKTGGTNATSRIGSARDIHIVYADSW